MSTSFPFKPLLIKDTKCIRQRVWVDLLVVRVYTAGAFSPMVFNGYQFASTTFAKNSVDAWDLHPQDWRGVTICTNNVIFLMTTLHGIPFNQLWSTPVWAEKLTPPLFRLPLAGKLHHTVCNVQYIDLVTRLDLVTLYYRHWWQQLRHRFPGRTTHH